VSPRLPPLWALPTFSAGQCAARSSPLPHVDEGHVLLPGWHALVSPCCSRFLRLFALLAVRRSSRLAVRRSSRLAVRRSSRLAVRRSSRLAVRRSSRYSPCPPSKSAISRPSDVRSGQSWQQWIPWTVPNPLITSVSGLRGRAGPKRTNFLEPWFVPLSAPSSISTLKGYVYKG
jgi:hypothetical protein